MKPVPEPSNDDKEIWLWSSITIGDDYIGAILNCYERGVEAVNGADKVSLGMFTDEAAAENALFDNWAMKPKSNGGDDVNPEVHSCAQCHLDPPDGNERQSAYNDAWLHPRCEEAFIRARMAEEGLLGDAPSGNGDPHTRASEEPHHAEVSEEPHPMLAAALGYAMRGWDVFPAPPGAKKSFKAAKYSNGAKWGKTRDPEQILRDFQRWPDANIGIPTGVENGIFVVETDTKKGHDVDGDASMAALEQKHGKLPDTRMAESPSGSRHRYFKHPGNGIKIMTSASMLGPGIDVRGDGGMVIGPPSARGDGEYRWINDNDIAEAPQWLLDLVTSKSNGKSANGSTQQPPRFDIAPAFAHLPVAPVDIVIDEIPPQPIEPILQECGWLREAHETGGKDYDQPQWHLTTLAAVFLENGHQLAHQFGNKHPEYSLETTEEMWERKVREQKEKNLGWPQCKTIEAAGSEHCKSCPHLAEGKSPLNLALQHDSPAARARRAAQIAENIRIGDDVTEPPLPQIMSLEEMRTRLVFVGSNGVVADTVTGRVRKKEHAADEYAASQHSYTLQSGALKKGPALKFWIASKDRITVEVLAWVPGAGVICQPPEGPGPAFNMWRGLSPMAFPEDWRTRVEPFLEHVEFLVPVAQERERFLQWLAHIVKAPEVLPHTAYLMTTPTTGIGRNWMASVLVRVLRGHVAAGISLPELLDGGFTGRMSMKLLAIVDEAREGSGERRYQRATRLTSLLTEEHRHVNHKYGYQSVEKNCGRWLMFSNHDDAIPFDNSDRRIIVIANPTTRKEDAYYERLYGLLGDKDFIGSARHWLETRDITTFRPGEHAPMNQIKLRILNEMMSETERAVAEFKEDCGTELTSRDAIKNHVSHTITKNGSGFASVNDTHLTHAIRRAGMMNTGHRIRAYGKNKYFGMNEENRFTVVIVRGEWTTDIVKRASPGKLLEAMGLKDWSTVKPQR